MSLCQPTTNHKILISVAMTQDYIDHDININLLSEKWNDMKTKEDCDESTVMNKFKFNFKISTYISVPINIIREIVPWTGTWIEDVKFCYGQQFLFKNNNSI